MTGHNEGNREASRAEISAVEVPGLPEVSRFLETAAGFGGGSPETLRWKCMESPEGAGLCLAARMEGRIAGTLSASPRALLLGRNLLMAWEMVDGAVSPDFRGKGLYVALTRALLREAERRGAAAVYGLPNRLSREAWEKHCGMHAAPGLTLLHMTRPLGLFPRPPAPIEELRTHGFPAAGKLEIRSLERFESPLPILESSLPPGLDAAFRRSPACLNWRFFGAPGRPYIAAGAFESGRLAAYGVLRFKPRRLGRAGYLVELAGREGEARAALLDALMELSRRAGARWLSAWAPHASPMFRLLAGKGFLPWRRPPVLWRWTAGGPPQALLPSAWHFAMSDSDNV